jgi:small-conductance mechanosensitive channel
MPGVDFSMATSFVAEHRNELTAAATLLLAVLLARFVDVQLTKRGRRVGQAVGAGELSPVAVTRLRLVRRLVFATIILIGVALALAQFPSVKRLATGLLASSAVLGLIVGFAARQTLANGIAGILLAITQPIRIGDLVTFEEHTGEVEDVRLTYTYIRLDDGTRLIVPNERLAQSSVQNHTILDPRVQVEVSVWLPPGADLTQALDLVVDEEREVSAGVAEVDKEGVRLKANTWADNPRERGEAAARLRLEWLRRLREHGLTSDEAP